MHFFVGYIVIWFLFHKMSKTQQTNHSRISFTKLGVFHTSNDQTIRCKCFVYTNEVSCVHAHQHQRPNQNLWPKIFKKYIHFPVFICNYLNIYCNLQFVHFFHVGSNSSSQKCVELLDNCKFLCHAFQFVIVQFIIDSLVLHLHA